MRRVHFFLLHAGTGIHDLPGYLSWSGIRDDSAKPLSVVLTHLHFDHSGGLYQFSSSSLDVITTTAIHTSERDPLAKGDPIMTAAWVTSQEVSTKVIDLCTANNCYYN